MNTSSKKISQTSGDSGLRRQPRSKIWILWAISFIFAFTFWLYAAGADNVNVEESFDLISIEYDNSRIKENGLVVQSLSIDTVNVTIMGSQRNMKNVLASNIKAYISLDSINQPGKYSLPVSITTPDHTTVTAQTVEKVTVTVDKSSEKSFPITTDSIELSSWNLKSECYFGKHKISATKATVTGPTLELDAVNSIKIRTSNIGTASNGQTVAAEVILLDKFGDEIKNKNLNIKVNSDMLTVELSVYMRKTVKLTLDGKYGYFDDSNVEISPSHVRITGAPDIINSINSIPLASIDETKEHSDRAFSVNIADAVSLPEGVEMTLTDGSAISSADINITVSSIKTTTVKISPKNIEMISTGSFSAQNELTVLVRFSAYADQTLVGTALPSSCIIASADATGAKEGDEVSVFLRVADAFKNSIYILDASYTVIVGASQINDNTPSIGGQITPL